MIGGTRESMLIVALDFAAEKEVVGEGLEGGGRLYVSEEGLKLWFGRVCVVVWVIRGEV